LLATGFCGFIDNIVINALWGSEGLAAVGYFAPLLSAFGLAYVVILGAVILAGGFIGSGQQDQVNSPFLQAHLLV
jgi:Na+-driven multidrug efflux pump